MESKKKKVFCGQTRPAYGCAEFPVEHVIGDQIKTARHRSNLAER